MKIKFIFIFPALVFFTDNLPAGIGGRANGPIVRIKSKYKQDPGIMAHELEHVKQWYLTLMLHPLLYKFNKKYRLWAELRAYKKQLKHIPENRVKYAGFIATRYGLDLWPNDVYEMLGGDR
jgi:hypothetical protein